MDEWLKNLFLNLFGGAGATPKKAVQSPPLEVTGTKPPGVQDLMGRTKSLMGSAGLLEAILLGARSERVPLEDPTLKKITSTPFATDTLTKLLGLDPVYQELRPISMEAQVLGMVVPGQEGAIYLSPKITDMILKNDWDTWENEDVVLAHEFAHAAGDVGEIQNKVTSAFPVDPQSPKVFRFLNDERTRAMYERAQKTVPLRKGFGAASFAAQYATSSFQEYGPTILSLAINWWRQGADPNVLETIEQDLPGVKHAAVWVLEEQKKLFAQNTLRNRQTPKEPISSPSSRGKR